jgi:hypothetical protein
MPKNATSSPTTTPNTFEGTKTFGLDQKSKAVEDSVHFAVYIYLWRSREISFKTVC